MKRFSLFQMTLLGLLTVGGVQGAAAQSLGDGQATYSGWTGTTPATAAAASTTDEKTVYLYNVNENAFLTRGGRWGTEAVLGGSDDLVLPFYVVESSGSYRLQTQAVRTDAESSSSKTNYLGFTGTSTANTTPSVHDQYNFFTDIPTNNGNDLSSYITYTFSSVSSATNTYRISLTLDNTTYYMQGTQTRNSNSTSTAGRTNYVTVTTTSTDAGTTWKLVTLKEIKDYAEKVTGISVNADPVTYAIADPDYARNDNSISSWKNGSGVSLTQGWAVAASSTSPSSESWTYYVGNGLADNKEAGQDTNGGTMAANIYGQGKIYQTVTTTSLPRKGWYEVSCNALTNDGTVKLYASVAGSKTYTTTHTQYADKLIQNGITISPATFLRAAQLIDSTQTDDNGNTTNLYRVICAVYIDETSSGSGTLQSLEIGIDATSASSDAWTVVDDWQLRYLGDPTSIVILDETKESADYMSNQNKGSDGSALTEKSTVYLHRTLVANKWNSLVLPFDVSAQAITSKFGSGTVLAEFKGATNEDRPHVIYFENASSIKKGQLYLIKPMVGEPSNGSDVTVTSSHDSNLTLTDNFYRFESVNFGGADTTFPETVKGDTGKEKYEGETNLQFIGTYYTKRNCVKAGSYFLYAANQQDGSGSDGLWGILSSGDKGNMRGFRGWLSPIDDTQSAAKVSFHIFGIDGEEEVTAIDGIELEPTVRPAAAGIYNLNGQYVSDGTLTEGLPKGLYIVNGKKVVVR